MAKVTRVSTLSTGQSMVLSKAYYKVFTNVNMQSVKNSLCHCPSVAFRFVADEPCTRIWCTNESQHSHWGARHRQWRAPGAAGGFLRQRRRRHGRPKHIVAELNGTESQSDGSNENGGVGFVWSTDGKSNRRRCPPTTSGTGPTWSTVVGLSNGRSTGKFVFDCMTWTHLKRVSHGPVIFDMKVLKRSSCFWPQRGSWIQSKTARRGRMHF